ncbi:MAG: DciA family protein [Vicinamibacterales bacterium]
MIHSHSVQPLKDVVSPALAKLLAAAPLSPGKVRFAWRLAVGPAIDRITTVTLSDGKRVEVSVADERWRTEVRRTIPLIRRRMEALLGAGTIENVVLQRPERPGGTRPERAGRFEDRARGGDVGPGSDNGRTKNRGEIKRRLVTGTAKKRPFGPGKAR